MMPRYLPLIFSGDMVRAILEGRKYQTRRLCKPQPEPTGDPDFPWKVQRRKTRHMAPTVESFVLAYDRYLEGDRIWVRETAFEGHTPAGKPWIIYRADDPGALPAGQKWKPSIHMNRRLCRLELECVRDCRIERLQAISEADAMAEGFTNLKSFFEAWDRLNGHRAPADSNPCVHVITFCVHLRGNVNAKAKHSRISKHDLRRSRLADGWAVV